MKKGDFVLPAALIIIILLLPLLSVSGSSEAWILTSPGERASPGSSVAASVRSASSAAQGPGASVTVLQSVTGNVITLSRADYLFGVVAAEMPPDYPDEALKAQAVAAYTNVLRARTQAASSPGSASSLKGADISDSSQGLLPRADAKAKWGGAYADDAAKIDKAVAAVDGLIVTYNGQPIEAAFTAVSSGKTEDAKEVWGSAVPYLQSVESIGDLLAPDYITTVSFPPAGFADKIKAIGVTADVGKPSSFISAPTRSPAGTVLDYKIGGTAVTGQQMRGAFGLRSANFDLAYDSAKNVLIFTVRGYGHDVGMSQYGAKYMADQGAKFDEILLWYYTGCKIQKAIYPGDAASASEAAVSGGD